VSDTDSLSKSGEFFLFCQRNMANFLKVFKTKSIVEVAVGFVFGSPVGEILPKRQHCKFEGFSFSRSENKLNLKNRQIPYIWFPVCSQIYRRMIKFYFIFDL